ncbi:alpha/beta fold hydrolase [Roseiarcus sp.]|uniref:alpha/beta fold hydrolase n=1 Tax=Roseiarcus sp. TaxID=1969460 RepID=UPI003F98E866
MPQVRANKIDIAYESLGRVTDPAILLIMGFSGALVGWPDALCEGLAAKGFRVIRFDNRDIGRSTHLDALGRPDLQAMFAEVTAGRPVAAPYALDDMAADAVGLIDALGIDRAHIVGASMGGMIAQLVAINHPAKAKSIVSIMSTTGRRDLPPGKPEAFAAIMTPPASPSREDRIARGLAVWRVIGSPGFAATDEELTAFVTRSADYAPYDPAGIVRQMAAVLAAPPRDERLRSVRLPALVIHGDADPLVPISGGEDTARSIPGAELLIIPGAGHNINEALTPIYLKAIGDFAAKVEAAG